jgi:hypothetical protein
MRVDVVGSQILVDDKPVGRIRHAVLRASLQISPSRSRSLIRMLLLSSILPQFFIKGVIYSPSPIGSHPSWTWPYGDFFIPQYANLWSRDFPLLKALGANTIRIIGWNNELDHGYFLDQAHRAGLKVIVTFAMGNAWQNPVHEEWQRQQVSARRSER